MRIDRKPVSQQRQGPDEESDGSKRGRDDAAISAVTNSAQAAQW